MESPRELSEALGLVSGPVSPVQGIWSTVIMHLQTAVIMKYGVHDVGRHVPPSRDTRQVRQAKHRQARQ